MVNRKILYYPTSIIPKNWLKWTLLYYDKVSSIIPNEWENDIDYFKGDEIIDIESYNIMKWLRNEGEYEAIRLDSFDIPIASEMEEILDSSRFQKKINKNWFDKDLVDNFYLHYALANKAIFPLLSNKRLGSAPGFIYGLETGIIGRIYKDKISLKIIDKLIERGLAVSTNELTDRFAPRGNTSYFVEGNVTMLYMALLAKHLAYEDKDYTVIGTDWRDYESLIFGTYYKDNIPSFRISLDNFLPIPTENTDIRKILKFKEKRKDELYSFRSFLDEISKEISQAENQDEIKLTIVSHREKMEEEINYLKKLMKDSDIQAAMASAKALIDIKQPLLWESLATSLGLNTNLLLLGATAAIQIGIAWIDKSNEQKIKVKESPFSYLYYAQKEGIALISDALKYEWL